MGPEAPMFSPDVATSNIPVEVEKRPEVESPIEKEPTDSLFTALDTLNNQYESLSFEKKALINLKQHLDLVLNNNSPEKFSVAASTEIFLALKAQMDLEDNFQPIVIAIDPQGRMLQLSFQKSDYIPSEADPNQADPTKSQLPKIIIEVK